MNIDEAIINIFHGSQGSFISGEEIARSLGISRTAVWQHIEKLKQLGYCFDAVTHSGYKLTSVPDRMLPDEILFGLKTAVLGKNIISYDTTGSTNTIAYMRAMEDAPEGTIVVAEYQENGRGRLDRSWDAPRGKNLLLSVLLRPALEPRFAPILTVMSAVGVALSIRQTTGLPASIKWPNDVLINNRKVAGILLEQKAELDRMDFLIVGIGVNINTAEEEIPPSLKNKATSLCAEKGCYFNRINFLQTLLLCLEEKYELVKERKFAEIIAEWVNLSCTLGKRIAIDQKIGRIEGKAIGIESSGSLLVEDDSGKTHTIVSGDLELMQ